MEPVSGKSTRAMKKKINLLLPKTGSTVQSPSSANSTPSIETMMAGLDVNDSLMLATVAPTVPSRRNNMMAGLEVNDSLVLATVAPTVPSGGGLVGCRWWWRETTDTLV
jgi:hypothetical protein